MRLLSQWLFTLGLALSALIDVIITGALCYYLQSNRTGYSKCVYFYELKCI